MKIEITLGVEKYQFILKDGCATTKHLTGNFERPARCKNLRDLSLYAEAMLDIVEVTTKTNLAEKEETVTLKEYVEEFKSVLNSITEQLP